MFHLPVPDPRLAERRPSAAMHPDVSDAARVLPLALPLIEEAAGAPADGAVSRRHDPGAGRQAASAAGSRRTSR